MQIGGYVADFPRLLQIDISDDRNAWRTAWTGKPAFITYLAALEEPLTVPLRFPLAGASGRYVRLRQLSADPVYYWSIAELHVLGS